ncbi:MAG: alpha/beta fold hydrolase [Litoreibacter sp.]|nr:alpha/beta fold hydrolase [Litoreibacter sp.]
MRRFGKWLGRVLLGLAVALAAVWFLWPREPVDTEITFDPRVLPENLDVYLEQTEARYDDISNGVQKRIIWAGEPGEQTDLSVIYVHGFSATSEEIRPVPDLIAKELGANLFYSRLRGHGRSGLAMAEPSAGDWVEDMAEALAVGRRLGKEVVVLSTSTGGTIAAVAAKNPELRKAVKGIVFISPNFRIKSPTATILEWPLARTISTLLAGAERSFDPQNEGHAKYWTTIYPTTALIPMAAIVRHARKADYADVPTPALFVFSDDDAVVDAETTRAVSTKWGGSVTLAPRVMGPEDDPFNHVIAGDILSPDQTAETAELIVNWVEGLP